MKKIFLLLGLAVLFLSGFYFLLISIPHPMGLRHMVALMILGATGFLITCLFVCEALNILEDVCQALAQRRLSRRIQKKGELFQKSCRTP